MKDIKIYLIKVWLKIECWNYVLNLFIFKILKILYYSKGIMKVYNCKSLDNIERKILEYILVLENSN